MKIFQFISIAALFSGIVQTLPAHAENRFETARKHISEVVASGNLQSIISALPTLEEMWPESMGDYFQSAEEIARFFDDAEDDPAVQQALENLYAEVLNKRCPEDAGLAQATAYFDRKSKVVRHSGQYENLRYNKPHLLAVSRFLGEIRGWRIPHYEFKRSWAEVAVLDEAGVSFASDLTDPKHIEAYKEAMRQNAHDIEVSRFQLLLFSADSSITSKLLGACMQLRHDGKLDEEFAIEVAENARLTEKEREMRYEFDKSK
ncbi:MAG: hypothetical protein WAQ74_08590 [Kiritimatiellia bacterium]|jgi:hypothetical protein|nr:hypothetical protein [Lentisphaerota bacterium]